MAEAVKDNEPRICADERGSDHDQRALAGSELNLLIVVRLFQIRIIRVNPRQKTYPRLKL
jgi:hypothetical protein